MTNQDRSHQQARFGKAVRESQGSERDETALSLLLQSLPREQASLGFEERVLRRVRAEPAPPFWTTLSLGRGVRLAAPLLTAAVLGFVFGPGLLERDSSSPVLEASGPGMAFPVELEPSPYGGPLNGSAARSNSLPNSLNNAQAQIVAMPGRGASPPPAITSKPEIEQIRAEATRVRRQLEELRRARSAAGSTITMTLREGVTVEVDLRDIVAELERRAAEMQERQRALAASGAARQSTESKSTEAGSANPVEPPIGFQW